jgi:hypothetical protein
MHGLRKWCEAFSAHEGRPPTDAEQLAAGLTGVQRSGDLVILRQAAAVYQLRSLDVVMGDEDGDTWLSTVAAPADDPQPTGSDRELDQVLQMLQPWPVLQEVMERRLAGQPFCEISLAMGMSERAAIRRGRQALALAQLLARNRAEGAELQEDELDSDEPPAETAPAPPQHVVYVQPSLLPEPVPA